MLVLTRLPKQRVIIRHLATGEHIASITVCLAEFGKVKLGFEANREIEIMREELIDRYDLGEAGA